jgi:hypothetical protein
MASTRWYADRVQETTTTTGTGNVTLAGVSDASYQSFNTAFGNGTSTTAKRFRYVIVDATNFAWEAGIGYLSASTTLVRETVTSSSNSGALVSFAAGTKTVFNDFTAAVANNVTRQGVAQAMISGNWMN